MGLHERCMEGDFEEEEEEGEEVAAAAIWRELSLDQGFREQRRGEERLLCFPFQFFTDEWFLYCMGMEKCVAIGM